MGTTQIRLDIIIIGAGNAGTSTTISLAQKGHRVRMLEVKDDLTETGAGFPPSNVCPICS